METDKEQQLEEIEAIEAIYPENIIEKTSNSSIIHLKVPQHEHINVQISLPSNYPSVSSPNILDVSLDKTHGDGRDISLYDVKYLRNLFQEVMDSVFHKDSVCIFDFLTELDGILYEEEEGGGGGDGEADGGMKNVNIEKTDSKGMDQAVPHDPFEGWIASDPITDRGSTFMAFATHVNSEEEAFKKLDMIKTDNKMRKAAHIMSAWRIKSSDPDSNVTYQDCDDDGETAAGSRMLHLITIMDVWNCMVIVARWFGGTHIGPDRFKHINSTAREAVVRAGFDVKR